MDLYEHYELFQATSGRGFKTFQARQKATGRDVLVHLVDPDNEAASEGLKKLPPEKRARVLAQGSHSGALFVVTEPGIGDFAEWLAGPADLQQTGKWNVTKLGMKTFPAPQPKGQAAGEFTRMFQGPV